MSNIPKYIEFLSNNSDYQSEKEFAQLLVDDENFRSGFKGYLAVTGAINSNMNHFGPSSETTNSIFSSLGFVSPNVVTKPVKVNTIPFSQSNLLKLFAVGLSSAVLAIIGTLLFIKPEFGDSNYTKNSIIQKLRKDVPVTESKDIINSEINHTPKPQIKYIYIEKPIKITQHIDSNNINDKFNLQSEIPKITESINLNEGKSKTLFLSANGLIESSILPFKNNIDKSMISSLESIKLNLEIKNSINWNVPKETIYPNEFSKLNNMSIALLYQLNNNIELGLDARQETFFVKYTSIDSNSFKYIFEQQPNFASFGILARYKTYINDDYLILFQSNFAGNYYGFIARAGLGFEYQIYPQLSISGIVEYSNLFYQHQGNWNSSGKIGFNYGINFKF
jgi:hypothetical protein